MLKCQCLGQASSFLSITLSWSLILILFLFILSTYGYIVIHLSFGKQQIDMDQLE